MWWSDSPGTHGKVRNMITQADRIRTELTFRDRTAGCWEFTGQPGRRSGGWRPVVRDGKRTPLVARFVLEIELGRSILPTHGALHTCDNGFCYNPSHIYEGTQLQNMQDKMNRNRYVVGLRYRGEKNPNSKLTDAQRVDIIADLRGSRTVAPEYGVSSSAVRTLRRNAKLAESQNEGE